MIVAGRGVEVNGFRVPAGGPTIDDPETGMTVSPGDVGVGVGVKMDARVGMGTGVPVIVLNNAIWAAS